MKYRSAAPTQNRTENHAICLSVSVLGSQAEANLGILLR
jgi:hypothetical protein